MGNLVLLRHALLKSADVHHRRAIFLGWKIPGLEDGLPGQERSRAFFDVAQSPAMAVRSV
jgi:hypothetical protein